MTKDDLPLMRFDFRPPPCQVIIFPMEARIGKARHVAEKCLSRKSKEQRTGYWNLIVKNLTEELEKRGLQPDQIQKEIEAFRDAVEAEMRKAHAQANQSPRPAEWDDGPQRA